MPNRSPYSVLGISRTASGRDVRSAFRTLALRSPPDTGTPDRGPFIEVQQAYEVLRDPDSRREWDDAHARYSERRHTTRFTSPIVDLTSVSYADARQARAVAPDLAVEAPSLEGLFDSFFDALDLLAGGFVHEGRAREPERLFYDLVLTPDEAARGGRFSFTVPLRRSGELAQPELHVVVPPGARDGQRATLALPQGEVTVTILVA
jgi:DnaJ-class molecular chaperone